MTKEPNDLRNVDYKAVEEVYINIVELRGINSAGEVFQILANTPEIK
jgi:hypothetical protein